MLRKDDSSSDPEGNAAMFRIKCFGILGGDKRQIYCARSIAGDGFGVCVCGFEKYGESIGTEQCRLEEAAEKCDAFILPLPCTKDGASLNAPFAENIIMLEEVCRLTEGKPVFCGMKNRLPDCFRSVFDYSQREEFAVENAVPTAEGAIEIAMREYEGTVNSSRCLVAGYGRIGRILAGMLNGIGANVTVSARKLRDKAFIRAAGMNAVSTSELTGRYDIIFNTVPHLVFDAQTLARTSPALVIDLASAPGGVDFEGAARLSIKTIHALSLPGKAAPAASGVIIKNAVYNIIREEQL